MFDPSIRRGLSYKKKPKTQIIRRSHKLRTHQKPKINKKRTNLKKVNADQSNSKNHYFLGRKKRLLEPILKDLDKMDKVFRASEQVSTKEVKVVQLRIPSGQAGQENIPHGNFPKARTSFMIKRKPKALKKMHINSELGVGKKPKPQDLATEINKILDSPKAKRGKQHFSSMTEEFIEILNDKKEVAIASCQTENLISKAVHTNGLQKNIGLDQSTQIMERDPFLFDFDSEVDPIVRVLVNRTLEQARMEVLEEEELMLLSQEKRVLDGDKKRLLNEIQRITIKEYRLKSERTRREHQMELSRYMNSCGNEKIVCRKISQLCVRRIFERKENKLARLGFFEGRRDQIIRSRFLGPVMQTSEAGDLRNQQVRFLISKLFFEASGVLQNLHSEAIRKKEKSLNGFKEKSEADEQPHAQYQMSKEDGVKVVEFLKLKKQYTKKERSAQNLVIGDSFNMFTMFNRDLTNKSAIKKESIEAIKTKTKIISQKDAGKSKIYSRNPKKYGKRKSYFITFYTPFHQNSFTFITFTSIHIVTLFSHIFKHFYTFCNHFYTCFTHLQRSIDIYKLLHTCIPKN